MDPASNWILRQLSTKIGNLFPSRRLSLILIAVIAHQISIVLLSAIEWILDLPSNDAVIDVSQDSSGRLSFIIKQMLTVSTVIWGIFVYFSCCLFTEYLDYVLFKHVLPQSSPEPATGNVYSIWLLEIPFEILYQHTKKVFNYSSLISRKLVSRIPEKDFWHMLPVVLFNIFLMAGILDFSYWLFDSVQLQKQNFLQAISQFCIQIPIADLLFYAFHYWMHHDRRFYKFAHQQHHSTFATRGISALYNQWLDGLLEGAIPYLIAIWITKTGCEIYPLLPVDFLICMMLVSTMIIGHSITNFTTVFSHSG
jgi:hypothetical protein